MKKQTRKAGSLGSALRAPAHARQCPECAEASALLVTLTDEVLVALANSRVDGLGALAGLWVDSYQERDIVDLAARGVDLDLLAIGILAGRGVKAQLDDAGRWTLGGSPEEVLRLVEAAQRLLVVAQNAGLGTHPDSSREWSAVADALAPWPWPRWLGNRPR